VITTRLAVSGFVALVATASLVAQQVADLKYRPEIPAPTYPAGKGPRVAIDEAHHNFHTAAGRYRPFAELVRRDGYVVTGFTSTFTAASLRDVAVLVIANPLHARNVGDWSLPTPSAFTAAEIAAVRAWVETGGSLLLIADHMPFPGAAGDLARAFGVEFSNGYARPGHRKPNTTDTFARETGLVESAVTRGRAGDPPVTAVATFGGSAFRLPAGARPVLVFGPESVSQETTKAPGVTPGAPVIPIEGWAQGAVLATGRGRVAIFGEAAMFSAQVSGPTQAPMGMNAPAAKQNHQLLLNVLHWLSRTPGMPD
jgi:hypothetical protein